MKHETGGQKDIDSPLRTVTLQADLKGKAGVFGSYANDVLLP